MFYLTRICCELRSELTDRVNKCCYCMCDAGEPSELPVPIMNPYPMHPSTCLDDKGSEDVKANLAFGVEDIITCVCI